MPAIASRWGPLGHGSNQGYAHLPELWSSFAHLYSSFPRKREPSGHRCVARRWAPAFAGMTVFLGCRAVASSPVIIVYRVEKIAVLLDMRGEPQRMLARQPRGEFRVAPFERLDDPHMIRDRTRRPVFLMDRDLADRAHVDEQVFRHFGEQGAAAHLDDRLMKGDVRIRVLGEPLAVVAGAEFGHQPTQVGNFRVGSALGGEPRRHAFERRHNRDHLDDLALRLAHDEDAAARAGADKAFLLEQRHRLAYRRSTHPEPFGEPPLVEPDLPRVVVDVHRSDRPLQRGIGFLAEGGAGVQPPHIEIGAGARAGFGHGRGIWYTSARGNRFATWMRDILTHASSLASCIG